MPARDDVSGSWIIEMGMAEPMSMAHRHRHAGRDDTCELPELLAPSRDKCNQIFHPIWSPSRQPAELIHAERTALFFDISDIIRP